MILKSFWFLILAYKMTIYFAKRFFFDVFTLINILHLIAFPPQTKKGKITMTYTAVTVRVIKINVTCFHIIFCTLVFVFNFDERLAPPHSGGYVHRFNLGTTTDNQ